MARKFNIGRQGEQLLNEEWHKLFMTLKYLNYDRYSEVKEIGVERQAEIPNHALRLKSRDDLNYIEMYRKLDEDTKETTVYYGYPNTVEIYDDKTAVWSTLFDGYFHPASAVRPDTTKNLAPYQLCIDPKTGAIMYWDAPNQSWVIASATQYLGENNSYSGVNFQLISDLQRVTVGSSFHYPVPYVPYGKLFSSKRLDTTYQMYNNCAIVTDRSNLSWVHINASKLKKVDRRLIRINKKQSGNIIVDDTIARVDEGMVDVSLTGQINDSYLNYDENFINITSTQTEFYGFQVVDGVVDKVGELLIRDVDFMDVVGGIELSDDAMRRYKYIYSITYSFDDYPSAEGLVIQNKKTIGGPNSVYIGDTITDDVALFIDGLSLEQRGVHEDGGEYDIYTHDKMEGVITFADNDDAEIINQMQMSALIFPRKTHEFVVSVDSPSVFVDEYNQRVTVDLGTTMTEPFISPMVFCSGLGLNTTEILEDVVIENNFITINNFVLAGDEIYKCFIADTGNSFLCEGVLNSYRISNARIRAAKQYVVFVNGLLNTPNNDDIVIGEGYIDLVNAENAQYDELHYIVFEVDDFDNNMMSLVYDGDVSYHSIRIQDHNETVYDDCNCAIVYVAKSDIEPAGILLDEAAVEKPLNPADSFYKGNQIVRTTDSYGRHTYYIYDFTSDGPTEIKDRNEINEIESLVAYYANSGSIQLIGDNSEFEGYVLKYFAYSYANMIDEPLMTGYRDNLPVKVIGQDYEDLYTGNASKTQGWKLGHNSLSTYINGLIVDNMEITIDPDTGQQIDAVSGVTRYFTVQRPILDMKPTDYYGERRLLTALNIIYTLYGKYSELDIRLKDANEVLGWTVGDGSVRDYFSSVNLFIEAWKLAKYINEDLDHEHLSYVIENIERDEFVAAHRDFIFLETGSKDVDHKQIYKVASDAIETDFLLAPGTVNVYLNGVLLEGSEYCKFDNNKIMFNSNVCGLQQLPSNKDACLPDTLTNKDKETFKKLYEEEPKKVLRIIEDKPYYIPTSNRDTILVEKRDDTSIKTITFDLKSVSYNNAGTIELTQDFYDIPESLMGATEHVKIYINGVYYDEGYTMNRNGGIKSIKLTKAGTLYIDPVYTFINDVRNKNERLEYESKHGIYQRRIDKITFEWR